MKLREFFYFTKSDRQVLLIVFLLLALALFFFWFLGNNNTHTSLSEADSLAITRQMEQRQQWQRRFYRGRQQRHYQYAQQSKVEKHLVAFDPNTADSSVLLGLGLQEWQVANIYKYRAAGGVYRRPQDFARLYGLTRKQYKELEPYIHISEDYLAASTMYNYEPAAERDTIKSPVKIKPLERVAVNAADTNMLKKVPGIGSHFARKIVQYRQRLGGFYDIHQLLEIEDFPESSLTYFVIPNENLRKIHINTATLNELKKHPYVGYFRARAIVDYRRLKGPLKSLQDLKLLKDFPPQAIKRLEPYVVYE